MKVKEPNPIHAFLSYITALFVLSIILSTLVTLGFNSQLNSLEDELHEKLY